MSDQDRIAARCRAELELFSENEERQSAERLQTLDVSWQSLSRLLIAGTATAILLGCLIVPLGLMQGGRAHGGVNGFQALPDGQERRRPAGELRSRRNLNVPRPVAAMRSLNHT